LKWFVNRWFNEEKFLYVGRGRTLMYKYDYEYIINTSKKYKYIYKAAQPFREVVFDGKYVLYLFSNIELSSDVIDFLNDMNLFKFMNNPNIITLYSIKEKIEIL
jgi:hypothetical protein